MTKNPREPKNVKKLIADAEQRQRDRPLLNWLAKIIGSDEAARNRRQNGGGTRGSRR